MFKLSRSYLLSVLITALMTTCLCAQNLQGEPIKSEKPGKGDVFPHFQLTDTDHQTVELYDYFQTQPVLLIYYRGGW